MERHLPGVFLSQSREHARPLIVVQKKAVDWVAQVGLDLLVHLHAESGVLEHNGLVVVCAQHADLAVVFANRGHVRPAAQNSGNFPKHLSLDVGLNVVLLHEVKCLLHVDEPIAQEADLIVELALGGYHLAWFVEDHRHLLKNHVNDPLVVSKGILLLNKVVEVVVDYLTSERGRNDCHELLHFLLGLETLLVSVDEVPNAAGKVVVQAQVRDCRVDLRHFLLEIVVLGRDTRDQHGQFTKNVSVNNGAHKQPQRSQNGLERCSWTHIVPCHQ